jgi:hypothetical protein
LEAAVVVIALRLLISPFLLHRDSKIGHAQAVSGLVASHQSALSSVIKERDEIRENVQDVFNGRMFHGPVPLLSSA